MRYAKLPKYRKLIGCLVMSGVKLDINHGYLDNSKINETMIDAMIPMDLNL